MGMFSTDWPEPSCEEQLKAERKRNEELQAQVDRLSLRIQEDLIKYERRGTPK